MLLYLNGKNIFLKAWETTETGNSIKQAKGGEEEEEEGGVGSAI